VKFNFVIAVVLLLAGCANPPYKFTPDEPVAFIKPVEGQTWSFCKDGKMYGLTKTSKSPRMKVPANKKIVLTNSAVFSGYQVSYSCYPMIGFTPEAGKTYVSDLTITMSGCGLGLAEEDVSSETGLKPVLSIGAPYCPAK
jgi:hypothetical protein